VRVQIRNVRPVGRHSELESELFRGIALFTAAPVTRLDARAGGSGRRLIPVACARDCCVGGQGVDHAHVQHVAAGVAVTHPQHQPTNTKTKQERCCSSREVEGAGGWWGGGVGVHHLAADALGCRDRAGSEMLQREGLGRGYGRSVHYQAEMAVVDKRT
jgi:hypothetical protein